MIGVYKYDERAIVPTRANPTDAGLDLHSLNDVFVPVGTTVKIDLGIAIEIPVGYVGKIECRSSLGAKGFVVSGGVVDATFTGSLSVILTNLTCKEITLREDDGGHVKWSDGYQIKAGHRIAQLLIYKVETIAPCQVVTLWPSTRGDKSFGSSGK